MSNLPWRQQPPKVAHLRLGRRGERIAARYLKRRHHHLLAHNFRCSAGEIDLICSHQGALVFVEVKTRASGEAADLQDIVRSTQWRRIENAARYFLRHRAAAGRMARFDLVTVTWPKRGAPSVEHFEDVYQPAAR